MAIIASIDCVSLLVRRKILRLYWAGAIVILIQKNVQVFFITEKPCRTAVINITVIRRQGTVEARR
ncbi:unknown [Prevotella sp. CAG:487]|nr:unknown [Prevotella sp. CAG:487]